VRGDAAANMDNAGRRKSNYLIRSRKGTLARKPLQKLAGKPNT